jgi:glutathione synthase/RimK-type ligase-like ATP-grasp enzyme
VEKQTKYQKGKILRCKLLDEFEINDKNVINDCITVTNILQADFIGVDMAKDYNNKYYLIEANLGPAFSGISKITKEDPIEIVANDIVRYYKNTK